VLRFVHGLIKKVIIADPLGVLADAAFSTPDGNLTTLTAWIGVTAYTFQIYFDFSGYSDMAIGLARMLGFRFPENFNRPYSSVSVTDFWRRWHMTLSAWFRDYLYIPLGGDRVSQARTCEPADRVPLISNRLPSFTKHFASGRRPSSSSPRATSSSWRWSSERLAGQAGFTIPTIKVRSRRPCSRV
jgi:hypothetical protein